MAVFFVAFPAELDARKKEKVSKEEQAVSITLYLNENAPGQHGEGRILDGYLRPAMVNDPDFLEVSLTPDGERVRYASEDVDSLTITDNLRYVKRKCRGTGLSSAPKIRWVRIFDQERGIDVYSAYFVTAVRYNNVTVIETTMDYYISLDDDVAISVGSINCDNPYYTGDPDVNRAMLAHYFGKIYGYGDFAERIKSKEFNTLKDVVEAWRNGYSEYPVRRT